ncbi:UDP-glucose 4-epimerase [Arcticibacter svalbardensis MN12-7]|uniref:UDP-glucose 4-epimerase n=1 Tax=Arcticibacter svalbardensis MN12-7 TaxID=1150600 RepID=R9GSN1_9SPHI|nr:SDR family oxidoreductase [Arcticibacter svalbardensis]EOR94560.1 UDP-glucose 4-epimerase [Arcticibacter svalbardensis MN12-7]
MAYFASSLTNVLILPEYYLDVQLFGDVRKITQDVLEGVDAVIHLAAISNDPMGSRYEKMTFDVNYKSSVKLAEMAKAAGASSFVFASSCSVYGAAGDAPKTETSELNPLTAYAKSKVSTEFDLEQLADENFTITCLRFATACGMSSRLRLDLVLNDFVAGAVTSGQINILSDGSPWRPLIHVKDMARAMEWAVTRNADNGGEFLAVNAGCKEWNYQVKEIAEAVIAVIPGTSVVLNKDAAPDKRSYRVNFDLFKQLAPDHQPIYTLQQTIRELYEGLIAMNFADAGFRDSLLMRLMVLTKLQESGLLNDDLEWNHNVKSIPSPETITQTL